MNVAENAKNNNSVTETEDSAQNYHHDISGEDNRTVVVIFVRKYLNLKWFERKTQSFQWLTNPTG